jgi:hypothetical protein
MSSLGTIAVLPLNQLHRLSTAPSKPIPYKNAYKQVKDVLKDLLHPEVEHHKTHLIVALKQLTPAKIVEGLWHQFDAYWHGKWPFDLQVENENPLTWWTSLQGHPHARVLAVCHRTPRLIS